MPLPMVCPDLVSLDLFLSVVRLGSLSRAAAAHGVAQPSASQRIRQLERQVGTQLLERSPQGSIPTQAGALLAEWAGAVVDAAGELAAGIEALRREEGGHIVVSSSLTIAECLLPSWLVGLRQAVPSGRVELEVTNSSNVLLRVADGYADLGFVESPGSTAGLSSRVIGTDELVVVVASDHPWARRRRPIDAATLAATALVVREHGSGTRQSLDDAIGRAGLGATPPLLELGSTTAVKAAAMTGSGPAVLSRLAVAEQVATRLLVLVPVDGLRLERKLRAVWRPTVPLPALAARLLRRAATG